MHDPPEAVTTYLPPLWLMLLLWSSVLRKWRWKMMMKEGQGEEDGDDDGAPAMIEHVVCV